MNWFWQLMQYARWTDVPERRLAHELPGAPGTTPERRRSRLDSSIANDMTGLGTTGDKGTNARPNPYFVRLSHEELTTLYRRNGYARRFICILPDDGTRKGWSLGLDEHDKVDTELRRLQFAVKFMEALIWSRTYGSACLMFVDWGNPMQEMMIDDIEEVRNIVVLDDTEAIPYSYDSDITSARFGEVMFWRVQPKMVMGTVQTRLVHWSRILHFRGTLSPIDVRRELRGLDDCVLEYAWDQIRNKTTIDQASAVIANEFMVNVLKIKGLAEKGVSDQQEIWNFRVKSMAQSLSLVNMVTLADDEEFTSRAAPISGFNALDDAAKYALAGVTGIPTAVFFGEAPGGLNADGDSHRASWANVVKAYQETFIRPNLTRAYTMIFAAKKGPFAGKPPKDWDLTFNKLDELTEQQDAAMKYVHAQTDQLYLADGVLSPEHVAMSRFGGNTYGHGIKQVMPADLPEPPETVDPAVDPEMTAALNETR